MENNKYIDFLKNMQPAERIIYFGIVVFAITVIVCFVFWSKDVKYSTKSIEEPSGKITTETKIETTKILDQLIVYTNPSNTRNALASINQKDKNNVIYENAHLADELIETPSDEKLRIIHNELIKLRSKLNKKE
jgi:flagellar biosynthesis/type III secretory pathway M-ring protein FliF/YscJ